MIKKVTSTDAQRIDKIMSLIVESMELNGVEPHESIMPMVYLIMGFIQSAKDQGVPELYSHIMEIMKTAHEEEQ